MFKHPVLLALLIATVGALQPAAAIEFVVTPDGASRMRFESKAPMETFDGKTKKISGSVDLDPAQLAEEIAVRIEVDLASLDTGSAMRNKHMYENHLHVDKYPKAVFTGGKLSDLSATQLTEGAKVTGNIAGTMSLHGVEKPLQAPIELTYQGGGLHVTTRFKIKLADYSIPRPQFLMMKLDESQSVTVDLDARPKP
jgi:polyisoprenoid-binding protein YceI